MAKVSKARENCGQKAADRVNLYLCIYYIYLFCMLCIYLIVELLNFKLDVNIILHLNLTRGNYCDLYCVNFIFDKNQ